MVRLRRSDTSQLGWTRVRAGRGFSYRDEHGELIADRAVRERLRSLAIPPAWSDVWISPHERGHIQAVGTDDAGRRQYLYHDAWRERSDRIKFDRALELATTLPAARARATHDLRRPHPDRERALGAAFRMLDTASLRVGSEQYAEQHGSHGLSTLLCEHVRLHGDEIDLNFPAKSGQEWSSTLHDADLARVIRALKRRGSRARLLAWHDVNGWRPLDAAEINDYVRECTGGDFTAKDFRTLSGTIVAGVSLARHGVEAGATARRKAITEAVKAASDLLENTPTIARSSYIDPRIFERYERGDTMELTAGAHHENALLALLGE